MNDSPLSPTRRILAAATAVLLASGAVTALTAAPAAADDAPVDGARGAGDPMFPNVGNGGYDALDYDIDIAWTPSATPSGATMAAEIVATSTMTARALVPLRSFSLDFEGLEIDAVLVNGVPAAYERVIDADTITYKLVVTPATPVTGEFTTEVSYHGAPSRHLDADGSWEGWSLTADGATMLGQPIGSMTAFPHNNTPADKATYSVSLDIPTVLGTSAGAAPLPAAAVSNGDLVARTASTDGLRTTWEWVQTMPMASELAVISIGRYDVIEDTVALTGGRSIPSWSFIDSGLSAENKAIVTGRLAQQSQILQNLESLIGAYPGTSTGVIVDSVPGITYALETQDRSFFPSARSVGGSTLIHEYVHQWYGNSVGPTTWTDIWIAEGMATYLPAYYGSAEGFGTGDSAESIFYDEWDSAPADDEVWATAPGAQTDPGLLYDFQTYTRGAQFWTALRIAIGDDAFFAFLEEWPTRHEGGIVTGTDVLALAEELSGRELDDFYRDWILDEDKPAWPNSFELSLTAAGDEPLERGDVVTYTLSALGTGVAPLDGAVATVDLAGVLDRAVLDAASLPAGLTLEGTTLTWSIPTTPPGAAAVTASFTVTVSDTASGGALAATASTPTLGGSCDVCATSLAVTEYPATPTPAPSPVAPAAPGGTGTIPDRSALAATGVAEPAPVAWWGFGLLAAGIVLLVGIRRRARVS